MSTSRSTRPIRHSLACETCKGLQGRPSGEKHDGGVLGLTISPKTLANLVERSDGPTRVLEELEVEDNR